MRNHLWFAAPLAIGLGVLLSGCSQPAPAEPAPADPVTQSTPAPTEGGGNQGGVQVHGGGAGMAAPVTGTENLQGGGGGVNQAAKDRARQAAGQTGSSLGQLPSDGD